MGKNLGQYQVEEFDPWEHFEDEDSFQPTKPKLKKVKKMRKDKPFSNKKRK